jgi:hypothetical protein
VEECPAGRITFIEPSFGSCIIREQEYLRPVEVTSPNAILKSQHQIMEFPEIGGGGVCVPPPSPMAKDDSSIWEAEGAAKALS